ncbi:tetratricopeptide repeat protein [Desulfonauticus submarinus]
MKPKVSRRDFLTGFFKKFRSEESGFTGLSPILVKADRSLEQGDYRTAIENYEIVLKDEGEDVDILKKCGYAYFRLHEFEQAREYFDKVMDIRPKEQFCLLYKGLSFAYEGNLKQAVEEWKSYFNIQKPIIQRTLNAIIALYEAGEEQDYQEVVQNVEDAILEQRKASSS